MENKVLKPKIRFKGFTDTWEQHKFSRLANVRRGLTYSPIDISKNGVRVLRSSNIQEDKFIYSEDDVFVNKNAINIDYVKNNDILITSANGSTRLVGKHALISGLPSSSAVHGGFMLLATANENPEFLNASMSSSWYSKFIELFVSGGNGAIGNLSKSDLDEQEILVPSSEEQKKLGQLFKMIDNLITLHQSKYDKLVNVKKALLEKMFPKDGKNVPEIRFKGFTDTWEQRKFKNYFDERNERTGIGEMISVTISSGIKKFSELNRYDSKPDDLSKYKRVVEGDIAYNSMRMWQGASGYSPYTGILSPAYTVIKPKDGISAKFFSYQIKRPEMIHQFELNSQGLTKDTLNLKFPAFSEIETTAPIKVNEQNKIAKLLEKVDNLITLHQHKLEKLKNMKKSLLNKMFI